jgi:Zn finger protein HypA/HybF involved in hydrogenase expression
MFMVTKKQPLHMQVLHKLHLYTRRDIAKAIITTSATRSPNPYAVQQGTGGLIELPCNYSTLIKLALTNEVLRTPIESLKKEALRNGGEIQQKYACKCVDCGAEYKNLKEKCSTPDCESTEFSFPDYSQKQKAELLLKHPNRDNSVEQINESLLYYMLSTDDYWLSYQQGVLSPDLISPVTVYVEDACNLKVSYSKEKGTIGNGEMFCPKHSKEQINEQNGVKKCPVCGNTQLKETAYVYAEGSDIKARFARDEIYHGMAHPWLPGFYGNSLILTGLRILLSVTAMAQANLRRY